MRVSRALLVVPLIAWLGPVATGEHLQTTNGIHHLNQHHRTTRNRPKGRRTMLVDLEQNDRGSQGKDGKASAVNSGTLVYFKNGEETAMKSIDQTSSNIKQSKQGGKTGNKKSGNKRSVDETEEKDFFGLSRTTKGSKKSVSDDESNAPSTSGSKKSSAPSTSGSKSQVKKQKKEKKSKDSKAKDKMSAKKSKRLSSTGSPVPTLSPTVSPTSPPNDSTSTRNLTPYGLLYTTTKNDRIPFRSELLEVVDLTRDYLQSYFEDDFAVNTDTDLEEFLTIFVDTASTFGEPVYIAYKSSAVFGSSSSTVPEVTELDDTLTSAFQGDNLSGYIGMLQALPQNNMFSTTISVVQTEVETTETSTASKSLLDTRTRRGNAAGVSSLVAAATAAAGILVLFYRRKKLESDCDDTITNKADNDTVTVTTGTWSLDQTAAGLQPLQHDEISSTTER